MKHDPFDFSWISKANQPKKGAHVLDYGKGSIVAERLGARYGKLGFSFKRDCGDDCLTVYYANDPSASHEVTLNRWGINSSKNRASDETGLIDWMKGRIERDENWTPKRDKDSYVGD